MKEMIQLSDNVYREEDAILRPIKPWTDHVHALLRHFCSHGLPVPQVIKTDDTYEYVEYIEGEIIDSCQWTDELLIDIAELTKKIHQSAEKFDYTKSMEWQPYYLREMGDIKICSHGDIAPWNVVTKDRKIMGLIDWELAGPISPIVELARICWLFPPSVNAESTVDNKIRAEQIRTIIDTYGLDADSRKSFFTIMLDTSIYDLEYAMRNISVDTIGRMWSLVWRNKNISWLWRNRQLIQNTIQ
jgi:tRNA A-37 threonylcarbamoyl transferase component Bud32